MFDELKHASILGASVFFLASNVIVFLGSIIHCWMLGWLYKTRRIFNRWEPLRPSEIVAA